MLRGQGAWSRVKEQPPEASTGNGQAVQAGCGGVGVGGTLHHVQKGQDPCRTEEDRGSGLRGAFPSKGRSGFGVGPVGLEPQGVLGGEGSLAGAGLALPRTPYGPCRSSGHTAAAGPLGCSPSCRAPRRQGRPSGAGLPLVRGPAAWGQHGDQVRGSWLGSRPDKDPQGPHVLACRLDWWGVLGGASVRTWSCWCTERALPGPSAAAPDGNLQGGRRASSGP